MLDPNQVESLKNSIKELENRITELEALKYENPADESARYLAISRRKVKLANMKALLPVEPSKK